MKSRAKTVAEYLASLPKERRDVVAAVRKVLRARVPKGYEETTSGGMIIYEIPLAKYPNTYNGKPLLFASIAAQKNHFALYLMCVYQDAKLLEGLRIAFQRAGKRLDMGKSCVRFKRVEDIPVEEIGKLLSKVTPDRFIAAYEAVKRR